MRAKLDNVKIRLAESDKDREMLFRFRYAIYIEEMKRDHKHANHETRIIEEPFDGTGANFIALEGDKIVGCIRSNCGTDTEFGEFVERYYMQSVGSFFPGLCNVNTRLVVSPEYRRSGLMAQLACEAYDYVRSKGMICDFIGCAPDLEGLFTRFGYIPYRAHYQRSEYKNYIPMFLPGVDLEHLQECRSPLAKIEERFERLPEVVRYLAENVYRSQHGYFKKHSQQSCLANGNHPK